MQSFPSAESSPPTTVTPDVAAVKSTVSLPALPNSCIAPMPPLAKMLSFSVPALTVPVLPARRMTVSLPLSPVTVADPVPSAMLSSPARPMMVPGPVSPVWFRMSLPAVPVTLCAMCPLLLWSRQCTRETR
jgi:hypothetical protein